MHFIVNIQREKESRMTSRSKSEDISLGRHALTSKPRLTPRLGLCQSASPSTDIFRSGTRGHSWFSYAIRPIIIFLNIMLITINHFKWIVMVFSWNRVEKHLKDLTTEDMFEINYTSNPYHEHRVLLWKLLAISKLLKWRSKVGQGHQVKFLSHQKGFAGNQVMPQATQIWNIYHNFSKCIWRFW